VNRWSLQTLGTFQFSVDGRELAPPPTQKSRALLAYLAWHRGTELPRERIVELFWPSAEPERGRSSFATALWSIRRCVGASGIDPDSVLSANRLRVRWLPEIALDARAFEELGASKAREDRHAALALYRGEFLTGDYSPWCAATRERVAAVYESLLARAVVLDADAASAQLLIAHGNLDEAPYSLVATNALAAGRYAAAALTVERYRAVLAEIGATPSPDFETRFADLRDAVPEHTEMRLPFCGRGRELAFLDDVLRRTSAGEGGVVLVRGDAGSGKTELVRRAQRAAADLPLRIITIAATFDDARAFGPWRSLYESLAARPFSAFAQEGGDATRLAVELRKAIEAPAVIIVDDAQYLAGDALAVLIRLAQTATKHGVRFVIATRPDGLRRLLAQLPEAARVDLEPLSYDEFRDGVQHVAAEDADAIAEFVYGRSHGHPFFAAKLLDALAQSGTLQRTNHCWALAGTLRADLQTPRTIRDFIEARLHARGHDPAAVACALALDHGATAEDLIAVCDLGESRTLDAIDDLLALGLLTQSEDGLEFRFAHDLIRETASRSVNSGRRVRLHRAYAARFEHDARRESLVRRAHHLHASGQVLPAARTFVRAASSLLEVNAWRDALQCTAAGIASAKRLLPSVDVHRVCTDLHEVAARACEEGGILEDCMGHADERVLHARNSEDPVILSRALARRSWTIMELQPAHEALADLDEAIALAESAHDDDLLFYAFIHRSLCRQYSGVGDAALADAHAALAAARRTGLPASIGNAYERILTVSCIWLRLDEAIAAADEGIAFARRGNVRIETMVRIKRSGLWYLLERWDDAQRELQAIAPIVEARHRPAAVAHGLSFPGIEFMYYAQMATMARVRGAWDQALVLAEKLVANPVADGRSRRGIAQLHLVEALPGRDAPGDADRALANALRLPANCAPAGMFGMSLTPESALARAAIRTRREDAPSLLRAAAVALTRRAERTPLDADTAFRTLADAAAEIGMADLATTMREQARSLRSRRLLHGVPETEASFSLVQ